MKTVVANVKSPRDVYQRDDQVGLDQLDRPLNPRFLSLEEREGRSMTSRQTAHQFALSPERCAAPLRQ